MAAQCYLPVSATHQDLKKLSGLCFVSKLVELQVVKQLMQHINSTNHPVICLTKCSPDY